jgi:hypothetical protein
MITTRARIGEIGDVLFNNDGKVDAFIVSVGRFLGIGGKEVAVPFNAIEENGKWYLTKNATKDALKNAPSCKQDPRTDRDRPGSLMTAATARLDAAFSAA